METFQYRDGEMYLIGSYANHYNSGTLDGDSVDTNFLTGDQILTKSKGEKTKETHRKIKVKPLVALPQATVDP